MKVLVFGAGAVGSYLGGRLCQAGHDVTLVVRLAAAEAIKQHGLAIRDEEQRLVLQPRVVTSLRQAFLDEATYDLILLSMKSYDTEMALNEMVAFCPSPPPLITLQNGIGIEEKFIEQFGSGLVTAGSLTTPISLESSYSLIVERGDRGLGLAPTGRGQSIGKWVKLFQEAGVTTVPIKNYKAMKWSKALLNMIGNASSAILNRHPRVVYGNPLTFKLEMRMLQETLKVMKKAKIGVVDLPGSPAQRLAFAVRWLPSFLLRSILANAVSEGRGNKMPSFHIDLAAGRDKSEVLYHNGAIALAGQSLGVPTPVNVALNEILLKLARKEIDWREYEGQPKRLAAEVNKYVVRRKG
jgi:2-dehydropantoate 2-reductase